MDDPPFVPTGATAPPTVWLLAVPTDVSEVSPDLLKSYGPVRSLFKMRQQASRDPEAALSWIVEVWKRNFRANDYVVWMGGDTLIALLAGIALEQIGVDSWRWLRYIGRGEYQVIPIQTDKLPNPTVPKL